MSDEVVAPKKRGRPKKVVVDPVLNEGSKDNQLQMEKKSNPTSIRVSDIMDGCTNIFRSAYGSAENEGFLSPLSTLNQYNPFLQNTRLKMISSAPEERSKDEIIRALKNPEFSERTLRTASWSLSSTQYLYYLILREAADVPLFAYYKIPPDLDEKEYSSERFQEEDSFVDNWLEKFDVVNTFKKISLEVKREGKSSYVVRNSICVEGDDKLQVGYAALQKLPTEFTKLTAIGQYGYIASFNMMIFLQPAFSPEQFPPFIQEIWKDMIGHGVVTKDLKKNQFKLDVNSAVSYTYNYKSTGETLRSIVESTKDKTYCFWVQLPQDLCYTFGSDTSHAWVVPDTAGLMLDLQELTDYSVLAGLIASTPLTSILTGEMELIENPSTGRDQTAMNPETVLKFQNLFNSMTSTNTEAFFAPLKNLKLQGLDNVPNSSEIKSRAVSDFVSVAGEGGSIITTEKPSIAQVKAANNLIASKYQFVVEQFRGALANIINKLIGTTYHWKISLFGDIFSKTEEKKYLKELVVGGMTSLLPKLLAYEGLTVRNAKAINKYLQSLDFYNNLMTLTMQTAAKLKEQTETPQQPTQGSVGRPSLSDDDLNSDETAKSRDNGINVSDNKQVYSAGHCAICGCEVEEGKILCDECFEEYSEEYSDRREVL